MTETKRHFPKLERKLYFPKAEISDSKMIIYQTIWFSNVYIKIRRRTCIEHENFDFEFLDTNSLKEHRFKSQSTSFSYNGKKVLVMMKGVFYHLRYFDNNGKVRHRLDVKVDDDSKWDVFFEMEDRIKQLIGYDNMDEYEMINRTSMVGLITYTDDANKSELQV